MINSDYELLDDLKQRWTNAELKEAIEILSAELRKSDEAIEEGYE